MKNENLRNKIEKELIKNGLLIGFDHASTPFWFTGILNKDYGSNISDINIERLIGKEIINELYEKREVWLHEINIKNADEWEADYNIKEDLTNIAKKIIKKTKLKVYITKSNKIVNEHYTLIEII